MRHREEWIRAVNTIPSISLTTCVILPWGREGRGDVTPSPQPLCSSGTGAKPFCDSGLDAWCWVLGAGIGCWVLINFPPSRKPGGGVHSCLKPRLDVAWPCNKHHALCWFYSIKFLLNLGKWVFKISFKALWGLYIFSQAFLFICPLIVIHSTYDIWLQPNIWLSSHLLLTHCSTKGLR